MTAGVYPPRTRIATSCALQLAPTRVCGLGESQKNQAINKAAAIPLRATTIWVVVILSPLRRPLGAQERKRTEQCGDGPGFPHALEAHFRQQARQPADRKSVV